MTKYKKDYKYSEYGEYEKKVRRKRSLDAWRVKHPLKGPVVCLDCGTTVKRTNGSQKRCSPCAKIAKVEYGKVFSRSGYTQEYRAKNRPKQRAYHRMWRDKLKLDIMSKYGPNGSPQCSWDGCDVTDLDMLTLDHLLDDGAEHRRKGFRGGGAGYETLKKMGFPSGFQTLCANHQFKKEHIRRRKKADAEYEQSIRAVPILP